MYSVTPAGWFPCAPTLYRLFQALSEGRDSVSGLFVPRALCAAPAVNGGLVSGRWTRKPRDARGRADVATRGKWDVKHGKEIREGVGGHPATQNPPRASSREGLYSAALISILTLSSSLLSSHLLSSAEVLEGLRASVSQEKPTPRTSLRLGQRRCPWSSRCEKSGRRCRDVCFTWLW